VRKGTNFHAASASVLLRGRAGHRPEATGLAGGAIRPCPRGGSACHPRVPARAPPPPVCFGPGGLCAVRPRPRHFESERHVVENCLLQVWFPFASMMACICDVIVQNGRAIPTIIGHWSERSVRLAAHDSKSWRTWGSSIKRNSKTSVVGPIWMLCWKGDPANDRRRLVSLRRKMMLDGRG